MLPAPPALSAARAAARAAAGVRQPLPPPPKVHELKRTGAGPAAPPTTPEAAGPSPARVPPPAVP
jgi:hypothetical protein